MQTSKNIVKYKCEIIDTACPIAQHYEKGNYHESQKPHHTDCFVCCPFLSTCNSRWLLVELGRNYIITDSSGQPCLLWIERPVPPLRDKRILFSPPRHEWFRETLPGNASIGAKRRKEDKSFYDRRQLQGRPYIDWRHPDSKLTICQKHSSISVTHRKLPPLHLAHP